MKMKFLEKSNFRTKTFVLIILVLLLTSLLLLNALDDWNVVISGTENLIRANILPASIIAVVNAIISVVIFLGIRKKNEKEIDRYKFLFYYEEIRSCLQYFYKPYSKFKPTMALTFSRSANIIASMFAVNKKTNIRNVFTVPKDAKYNSIDIFTINKDGLEKERIVVFFQSIITKRTFDISVKFLRDILGADRTKGDLEWLLDNNKIRFFAMYISEAENMHLQDYIRNNILVCYKSIEDSIDRHVNAPWVWDEYDYD